MRDLEFWYIQAEKLRLGRKQNNLIEMRLAMLGTAQQFKLEMDQIKWGIVSLDSEKRNLPEGAE